ncbi:MAG: DoxX family rane protein [Phycisphaerales bacterium]|nr:DoxX family rane protein [Phycisphaerales bacterium]
MRQTRSTFRSLGEWCRVGLRWVAAGVFVFAGVRHFTHPVPFRQIVPPALPSPALLVAVSGAFEIAGGLGLLIRPLRRAAGWGLVVLLVAVFPANVYMAMRPDREPGSHFPAWVLWARLPLQAVLIIWVGWAAGLGRAATRSRGRATRTPLEVSGRG